MVLQADKKLTVKFMWPNQFQCKFLWFNSWNNPLIMRALVTIAMCPLSEVCLCTVRTYENCKWLSAVRNRKFSLSEVLVYTGKSLKNALHVLQWAKRHLSDIGQWKNQDHSHSHYQVILVWRYQAGRQFHGPCLLLSRPYYEPLLWFIILHKNRSMWMVFSKWWD